MPKRAALIIAQTAAYFGLSIEELTGPSRGRHLVMARQIVGAELNSER